MSSSVYPCTLLELHVGSPRQQPTGATSAHVMALTHKPSFGRSVSQERHLEFNRDLCHLALNSSPEEEMECV